MTRTTHNFTGSEVIEILMKHLARKHRYVGRTKYRIGGELKPNDAPVFSVEVNPRTYTGKPINV